MDLHPTSAAGSHMSPQISQTTNHRKSWSGYALSLFFTAAGLVLLFWAGAQGLLWVCDVPGWHAEPGVLALEAVAGGLTSVFGFLMLVQVSPSIDAEAASAWTLPDQRVFDDDPSPFTTSGNGPDG
jgi:hypothetical protein